MQTAIFFVILFLIAAGWIALIYMLWWRLRTPENEKYFFQNRNGIPILLLFREECPADLKRNYLFVVVTWLIWEVCMFLLIGFMGKL